MKGVDGIDMINGMGSMWWMGLADQRNSRKMAWHQQSIAPAKRAMMAVQHSTINCECASPMGVIHSGTAVESIAPAKSQTEIGDGGAAMRCTMIFDDRGNGNPFLKYDRAVRRWDAPTKIGDGAGTARGCAGEKMAMGAANKYAGRKQERRGE